MWSGLVEAGAIVELRGRVAAIRVIPTTRCVFVLLQDCAIRDHKLKFDHLWISLTAATCVDMWTLVHLTEERNYDVLGWNLCALGRLQEYAPGKCGMSGGAFVRLDPRKHKRRWLFTSRNAPKLVNSW
jgi:hypothetical protein